MIHGLDLFSGIGGIGIGLRKYVRTIAYCERDRYAQGVLLSRMASNEIDRAPIWDEVTSLKGTMLPNIDIIFGGFPCQDISVAGAGKGLAGERSGLFYEIIRITKETNPSFVFLENVPAIRTRGLFEIVRAFTEIGYDCRWTCLSAASVGAIHKRERWFLLAHTNSTGLRISEINRFKEVSPKFADNGAKESLATAMRERLERQPWTAEPNVGRVANGVPNRVDRLKCLGNSVVPIQAKTAFEKLCGITPTIEIEDVT